MTTRHTSHICHTNLSHIHIGYTYHEVIIKFLSCNDLRGQLCGVRAACPCQGTLPLSGQPAAIRAACYCQGSLLLSGQPAAARVACSCQRSLPLLGHPTPVRATNLLYCHCCSYSANVSEATQNNDSISRLLAPPLPIVVSQTETLRTCRHHINIIIWYHYYFFKYYFYFYFILLFLVIIDLIYFTFMFLGNSC